MELFDVDKYAPPPLCSEASRCPILPDSGIGFYTRGVGYVIPTLLDADPPPP